MLWGHLGRRDKLPNPEEAAPILLPPLAPVDKNATSLRILLHDTQANFQEFSARVDKVANGVDLAAKEITTVKKLFEKEHDTLNHEMYDLVNRSQTQIQKTVGEPAQAHDLERMHESLDLRMECLDKRAGGIDKRIDALQTITKSFAQTLQTQAQALQNLQDQQATIIATLTPLLPLLQAVPLHIDAARSKISDSLQKIAPAPASTIKPSRTMQPPERIKRIRHDEPSTTSIEKSSKKRRRLDEGSVESVEVATKPSSSRPPSKRRETVAPAEPRPRRPLADLSIPRNASPDHTSSIFNPSPSLSRVGRAQSLRSSHHHDSMSRIQADQMSTSSNNVVNGWSQRNRHVEETPSRPAAKTASQRFNAAPIMRAPPSAKFTAPILPATAHHGLSSQGREARLPPSSVFIRPPNTGHKERPARDTTPTPNHRPHGIFPSNILSSRSTLRPPVPTYQPTKPSVPLLPIVATSSASTALRQRRSPFREGRRFIPLDDSDDEDDG
ncbi:hypothetical protein C8J56DRAFT_11285 [Mycena floridula]|nr:hypothetical protein C8J56DRAFT_11285 [Mycena floridula]